MPATPGFSGVGVAALLGLRAATHRIEPGEGSRPGGAGSLRAGEGDR